MHETDARRDLQEIRRMMEEGRRVVAGGGHHYVAWGLLITSALLLTWGVATREWSLSTGWIWGGAVGAGWIFSIWAGYRWDRRAQVSNLAGRVLAGIWVGTGITMTLVGFMGGSGTMDGSILLATHSAIIGSAYLSTAAVQGSRRMGALATGWWVGAGYMFLDPGAHTLLVMAGLMVAFFLIPGLWMVIGGQRPGVEGGRA